MVKKYVAVIACIMVVFALCGCSQPAQQPEQQQETRTPQEQLAAYKAIPAVDKYYKESYEDVDACIKAAQSGDLETALQKSVLVEIIYEDLSEVTDVPEAVAELHDDNLSAAEHLKNATDFLCDAAVAQTTDDVVGETDNIEKATSEIDKATGSMSLSNELEAHILYPQ